MGRSPPEMRPAAGSSCDARAREPVAEVQQAAAARENDRRSSDNGGGPKRARLHKEQAGRRPLLHSRRIFLWGKFEQRSGCIPKAELSTLLRAAGASVCDRLPTEIDMRQARDER